MDATNLLIDGPVFPIGKLNKNGWGIHSDAIESAIASLKTSVVRICPRTNENEHWCDLTGDRKAEIGRVADAYYFEESDEVRAVVLINDSVAVQKLVDGVWPLTWSVYGEAELDESGFAHEYHNKSVTFVDHPAWDDARGEVMMFASHSPVELKTYVVMTANNMSEVSPESFVINTTLSNQEDYHVVKVTSDGSVTDDEKQNYRGVNMTDNKENVGDVATKPDVDYEQVLASERAKVVELEKQVEALKKLTASAIPADKVEMLIASKVEEVLAAERAATEKKWAVEEYKKVCAAAGIDFTSADAERFANSKYSAADIQAEIAMIKKFAGGRLTASEEPAYAPFSANTDKDGKTAEDYQNEVNVYTVGHYRNGVWSTEVY